MTIDRDKVIPYGMAALVVALVALLVAIDVLASLPAAPARSAPSPEKPPEAARPQLRKQPESQPREKPGEEVQNMVLFTEVNFKDTKVTTGRRFRTPRDEVPSEQWCYILRSVRGRGAQQQIMLGEKRGAAPVRWFSLTPEAAADIGYPLSDLEAARDKCRFTGSSPQASR